MGPLLLIWLNISHTSFRLVWGTMVSLHFFKLAFFCTSPSPSPTQSASLYSGCNRGSQTALALLTCSSHMAGWDWDASLESTSVEIASNLNLSHEFTQTFPCTIPHHERRFEAALFFTNKCQCLACISSSSSFSF